MADVGVLAIQIVSNAKQFEKGLKDAGKSSKGFESKTSATFLKLAKNIAKATAAAFAFKKALDLVSETATRLDTIAKASSRLSINVEQFQKLDFAANLAGVNDFAAGIERLTRNLGEAQMGTGEAVNVLKHLRLNVNDLLRMNPEDRLNAIADAMQNLSSAARISAADKLFGSTEFANLLAGGREQIEAAGRRLEELGGIRTADQLAAAEDLKDAQTELAAAYTALKDQLAIAFMPAVKDLIASITEFLAWVNRKRGARRESIAEAAAGQIGEMNLASQLQDFFAGRGVQLGGTRFGQQTFAGSNLVRDTLFQRQTKQFEEMQRRANQTYGLNSFFKQAVADQSVAFGMGLFEQTQTQRGNLFGSLLEGVNDAVRMQLEKMPRAQERRLPALGTQRAVIRGSQEDLAARKADESRRTLISEAKLTNAKLDELIDAFTSDEDLSFIPVRLE